MGIDKILGKKIQKPLFPDKMAFVELNGYMELTPEAIGEFVQARINQMEGDNPKYKFRKFIHHMDDKNNVMSFKFLLKYVG